MTTVTAPVPNLPLPLGAFPDTWTSSRGRGRYRDVYSEPQCVLNATGDPFRSPLVSAWAVQLGDGSIVEPVVEVEVPAGPDLTVAQARELADKSGIYPHAGSWLAGRELA